MICSGSGWIIGVFVHSKLGNHTGAVYKYIRINQVHFSSHCVKKNFLSIPRGSLNKYPNRAKIY